MARRHDQSGIRNFDWAPAATLRTEPTVSDELLISRSFSVARTQSYVPIRGDSALLQVNRLIMPVRVELCAPHLVDALVLRTAEGHGCSKSNVKIAEILECSYQPFGIELGAIALQPCDQHAGVHITFERHVIWRYPGKEFGKCRFVF